MQGSGFTISCPFTSGTLCAGRMSSGTPSQLTWTSCSGALLQRWEVTATNSVPGFICYGEGYTCDSPRGPGKPNAQLTGITCDGGGSCTFPNLAALTCQTSLSSDLCVPSPYTWDGQAALFCLPNKTDQVLWVTDGLLLPTYPAPSPCTAQPGTTAPPSCLATFTDFQTCGGSVTDFCNYCNPAAKCSACSLAPSCGTVDTDTLWQCCETRSQTLFPLSDLDPALSVERMLTLALFTDHGARDYVQAVCNTGLSSCPLSSVDYWFEPEAYLHCSDYQFVSSLVDWNSLPPNLWNDFKNSSIYNQTASSSPFP